jgi:hypothetical protein
VGLRAVNKSGEKYNPGLAKRRALFPEGRGLGVGGRKREKKKVKEKRKIDPPSAVGGLKGINAKTIGRV